MISWVGLIQETAHTVGNAIYVQSVTPMFIIIIIKNYMT